MTLRTRIETLDFMLTELKAGRLGAVKNGSCVYESDTGTHCVVGCLFTPEQHLKIKSDDLNSMSLDFLLDRGYQLDAGGLTIEELEKLQSGHDTWAHLAVKSDAPTSRYQVVKRKRELKQLIVSLKSV